MMKALPLASPSFLSALLLVLLFSANSDAQTKIRGSLDDDDFFTTDPAEGIYDIFPDTQTLQYLGGSGSFIIDVAPRILSDDYYHLTNSRGVIYLQWGGSSGFSWRLSISPGAIAEGRDGDLYCRSLSEFYRLDPPTRTATLISSNFDPISDMATDVDGTLMGVTSSAMLVEIDRSTGTRTPIVQLDRGISSLAFSKDGRLWGYVFPADKLYQINKLNGTTTFVMDLPAIPNTWSSWGLGSETGLTQPSDSILLTSALRTENVGDPIDLRITNAPVSSPWFLFVSRRNRGAWISGHWFELGPNYSTIASGSTGLTGTGAYQSIVPPKAAGGRFYLEAGVIDMSSFQTPRMYDSNTLVATIQ